MLQSTVLLHSFCTTLICQPLNPEFAASGGWVTIISFDLHDPFGRIDLWIFFMFVVFGSHLDSFVNSFLLQKAAFCLWFGYTHILFSVWLFFLSLMKTHANTLHKASFDSQLRHNKLLDLYPRVQLFCNGVVSRDQEGSRVLVAWKRENRVFHGHNFFSKRENRKDA